MRVAFRLSAPVIVTFLVLACASGLRAQPAAATLPDLFEPATLGQQQALALQPWVVESQATLVRMDVLAALPPQAKINLNLLPDVSFVGVVERIEKRADLRFTVAGRLQDEPFSSFIIVVEEDAVAGTIRAPLRSQEFSLRYIGDGVHLIQKFDQSRFSGCATTPGGRRFGPVPDVRLPAEAPHRPNNEDDDEGGGNERGGCPAPRRHFDVMIYYTPAARVEAGGTNAIRAECQLAVDTTNQTYINSGIPGRMVLVLREEISYNETNDVETDRNRLTDPDDGFMDNVHAERNAYGGDFVCLFVDNSDPNSCGIAYCTPSGPAEGFCVVQRGCASGNFSFPHEIGHLQGCAHNREDAGSGCTYYCDSYGHRFFGNTGAWRTVMSYNDGPATYTRIGWFSNPLVNFDGVPTGAAGDCDTKTNNAGTIYGTTSGREGWRNPRFEVWVNFGEPGPSWEGTYQYPWPTAAEGIAAIYGGAGTPYVQPRLIIKTGSTNETPTISKPMRIEACGGTVALGD